MLLACAFGIIAIRDVATTPAARWPQFRGPRSLGVADGAKLPQRWSTTENVAWVVDVPGRGWSSPVVWDDKIFVTSAISGGPFKEPTTGIYGNDYIAELRKQGLPPAEVSRRVRARDNETPEEIDGGVEWRLLCLDAKSGRRLWDVELHRGKPFGGRHRKNTYASETPVTDGQRVYVYLGNIGLFAYSLDGKRQWMTPLEPKRIYLDFGTSSSPVVHDGRLFILNDNQEESYLAAFDCATGAPVWRTPRDFKPPFVRSSFSTPFIWTTAMRTEIVTAGPTVLASYGLDGQELWRVRGVSQVGAPTPVADGNLLVAGSGSPSENVRPLLAVRPGASGDITPAEGVGATSEALASASVNGGPVSGGPSGGPVSGDSVHGRTSNVGPANVSPANVSAGSGGANGGPASGAGASGHVAWYQVRGGSYITSPLAYDGRVYVLFDQGFFGASDLATGRSIYKVRIGDGGVAFSASPWAVDGRIFCLSEDGDTYVIQAGDEYKLLAKNSLGEMSLATPAIVPNGLFIRTATRLYRIGKS